MLHKSGKFYKMFKQDDFGIIGMALSCTLFLEGALMKYRTYAPSIDEDSLKIIREWNRVLVSLLQDNRYNPMLGSIGNKLLKYIANHQGFINCCVDKAHDVNIQSLHYVLRFQENVGFLDNKISNHDNINFVDFGCGFSPLIPVMQAKYGLKDTYCTDIVPEIADLYTNASYKLSGSIPSFIDWNQIQDKATKGELNTFVSVGCFPHIPKDQQAEYMKVISKKFQNFFLEIKYKSSENMPDSENAFSLADLQKLRMDVDDVKNIESAMLKNGLLYVRKFIRARADRRDFLTNQSRSIFLSR